MADNQPAAGYIVGWQDSDGRVEIVLDESDIPPALSGPDRIAFGELVDARLFAAEVGPEDPDTTFRVYGLHEVSDDATADDRAPGEVVTVPFETVVDVFLDGLGTGAASALAKVRPDAPAAVVDDAAQAIVDQVRVDPLAVEELRNHIRRRLRGETDNRTTEVPVWGDGE